MGYDDVKKSGYWWAGLYRVLEELTSNWNAALTKLDADLGDTTFATTYGVTTPTIGSTYGMDLSPMAHPDGKVILLLKNLRTNFNDAMDAVAGDDGVNGTTVFAGLKFGSTAHLIDEPSARAKLLGHHQDAIVLFLDVYLGRFNDFLDYLDADSTITDTDYFSLYGVTDVVEASSSSSSCRSSSSSCRSSSSSSCRSSSSSSSSSRSSSSSSSSSCRSSSSSSSCRSSSSSSSSCRSSSSSSSSRSSSSSSSSSRSSSSSSSSSNSSISSSSSSSVSSSSSCRSSSSSSSSSQAVS